MHYKVNTHSEIVFLGKLWSNNEVKCREGRKGKLQRYVHEKEFGWLQPAMAG
jgi:hypothetical protein